MLWKDETQRPYHHVRGMIWLFSPYGLGTTNEIRLKVTIALEESLKTTED